MTGLAVEPNLEPREPAVITEQCPCCLWHIDANRTTWLMCSKCEEFCCEPCVEHFDTSEGGALLCKRCVKEGALDELCSRCNQPSLTLRSVGREDTPTERDAEMEPGNPGSVPEPVEWWCLKCREGEK